MSQLTVYGAMCTWWDDISKVATKPSGLPCCPNCGGVLFQIGTQEWIEGAERYERESGNEGYVERLEWARGKCFPVRPDEAVPDRIREEYEAAMSEEN